MGGLKLPLTLKLTCEGSLSVLFFFFFTLDYATGVWPGRWRGGMDHAGAPSRGGGAFKALGSARQKRRSPSTLRRLWGKKGELGRIIGKTFSAD